MGADSAFHPPVTASRYAVLTPHSMHRVSLHPRFAERRRLYEIMEKTNSRERFHPAFSSEHASPEEINQDATICESSDNDFRTGTARQRLKFIHEEPPLALRHTRFGRCQCRKDPHRLQREPPETQRISAATSCLASDRIEYYADPQPILIAISLKTRIQKS
ncbi:MAG: hypothetical protein ACYYK0_02745 [Candidatus Eutrophobiaceae bacterium]